MPFYEYRCTACAHQDTFLESINAPQKKTCPQCRKRGAFQRLVSAAGFQLKGDGWYVTDFKNKDKPAAKNSGKENSKDSNAEKPAAKDKGDSKAEGKSESKDKSTDKAASKPSSDKGRSKDNTK